MRASDARSDIQRGYSLTTSSSGRMVERSWTRRMAAAYAAPTTRSKPWQHARPASRPGPDTHQGGGGGKSGRPIPDRQWEQWNHLNHVSEALPDGDGLKISRLGLVTTTLYKRDCSI